MSVIKIRGRADLIIRPYAIAKKLKQRKFGDDSVFPAITKALPTDLVDLGDEWAGTYAQIVSIELNDKPQLARIEDALQRPLTAEEKIEHRKFMDDMHKDLEMKGILKPKEMPSKMSLTRSGLNEYKAKFGIDYIVPPGTEIIEDVSVTTAGGG